MSVPLDLRHAGEESASAHITSSSRLVANLLRGSDGTWQVWIVGGVRLINYDRPPLIQGHYSAQSAFEELQAWFTEEGIDEA